MSWVVLNYLCYVRSTLQRPRAASWESSTPAFVPALFLDAPTTHRRHQRLSGGLSFRQVPPVRSQGVHPSFFTAFHKPMNWTEYRDTYTKNETTSSGRAPASRPTNFPEGGIQIVWPDISGSICSGACLLEFDKPCPGKPSLRTKHGQRERGDIKCRIS